MRNGTWKTLAAAALLCPAMMLTGCKSGGDGKKDGAADVTLAEPVEIVESKSGNSSALEAIGVMLVKTQAEYDALGDADIHPGVDFETQDLVIAALGEQPTGGYSIEITAIQQEGDMLFVEGKASKPGDAAVTQALTYPYAAAVIANTDATIVVPDID